MDNTSQYSGQDRERTEEELAGGPVSRGASNQSSPLNREANSDPTTAAASSGDQDDQYNKLVKRNSSGIEGDDSTTTNRNLGSVGGGPIPGGNAYSGMNPSSSTTDGSPSSIDSSANEGSSNRDSTNTPGMRESPGSPNASGQPQQGNIGGRNPGQTQNQPIGDQDTTFGHRGPIDDQMGDPMTSRAPDKVNQPEKQDS